VRLEHVRAEVEDVLRALVVAEVPVTLKQIRQGRGATRGRAQTAVVERRVGAERAQEAVDAGFAKPLEAIWPKFSSDYSGKVIGIEFTGFRWRPRYRFKAISDLGHLETVIVSARTGLIEKVVGC